MRATAATVLQRLQQGLPTCTEAALAVPYCRRSQHASAAEPNAVAWEASSGEGPQPPSGSGSGSGSTFTQDDEGQGDLGAQHRRAQNQWQQAARWGPERRQGQGSIWPVSVSNVSRNLTRQDLVDFFEGLKLTPDEVRVEYSDDHRFIVERFWCNFGSRGERDAAVKRHKSYLAARRVFVREARPEEFRRAVYSPLAMSSRGRYVLISNLEQPATSEDVLKFFHGYNLHAKSVTFIREHKGVKSSLGRAVVRFDSQEEAFRAVRSKHGSFCLNNAVQLKLLP
ncbi:hypothetical protein N2152v2_010586 [Parachlorella kessleri]